MQRIIIVDDEIRMLRILQVNLQRFGEIHTFSDPVQALEHMKTLARSNDIPSLLLTDIKMPGMSGVSLLERTRALFPALPVVIMTAYGSIERAVEAMKKGAADYLVKPLDLEKLGEMVQRLLKHQRYVRHDAENQIKADPDSSSNWSMELQELGGMVSRSAVMHELFATITKVAAEPVSVLIQGESGTGKELVARAIHSLSPRSSGPFIAVNCAAIPSELLESELFGHKTGAFTDAKHDHVGRFVQACGGTIFLDEIGELPLQLQPKLLRVVQELQVTPVGGTKPVELDIRLISATNRELKHLMQEGLFREDLYYRLNVLTLRTPSLRERPEDIAPLTDYLLKKFSHEDKRISISDKALRLMMAYSWPGNVRELENVLQHGIALSTHDQIGEECLPPDLSLASAIIPANAEELKMAKQRAREEMSGQIERAFLVSLLTRNQGNVSKSAKSAVMDRRQLQNLIRKHGINSDEFKT